MFFVQPKQGTLGSQLGCQIWGDAGGRERLSLASRRLSSSVDPVRFVAGYTILYRTVRRVREFPIVRDVLSIGHYLGNTGTDIRGTRRSRGRLNTCICQPERRI